MQSHFIPAIFTSRRYASAVYAVVVCLSVRQSVTRRYYTRTAKRRITQRTPYDSPETLVFCCQKSRRNSTGSLPTMAPNKGGAGTDRRFSTNISLYLRNGTR